MPFPTSVSFTLPEVFGENEVNLTIHDGVTTLVGPNGCGKTQLLRALKKHLRPHIDPKKHIRFLSAGRLGQLEPFRSIYDGRRDTPMYENVSFGGREVKDYRHKIETSIGDFQTMTVRPDVHLKVNERIRKLLGRDVILEGDVNGLKVLFSRLDAKGSPYLASKEASGLLHIVSVLAALYDDEVGAILVDEPEVSLHPQLQAYLLQEIHYVAGNPDTGKKLVIMATHSTSMISIREPQDLSRYIFLTPGSVPRQIEPSTPELHNSRLMGLIFRLGSSHKEALFSSRPLLVEGPSDKIICDALDHKLGLHLTAHGSHILPVIGKGEIPTVVKLMRLVGKEPVVLADLDSLADGLEFVSMYASDERANRLAHDYGHANLSSFARGVYGDFSKSVETDWSVLSPLVASHPYWVNRDPDKDERIARRRSVMASLLSTSEETISDTWPPSWLTLRRRLLTLFEFLEAAGCFILRRGTIEGYYVHAVTNTTTDKPTAANAESNALLGAPLELVHAQYDDIVRCLEYASSGPSIDEGEALARVLVAAVSPLLFSMTESTTDTELAVAARQMVGEKAGLFEFTNASTTGNILLQVDLKTAILDVSGFPVRFSKTQNPVHEVQKQVQSRSRRQGIR